MTRHHSLTPLVGSRICHDLINPLGAISNGVELLNMTPGAGGPEIALISESVEAANSRIRFFRVAYGGTSETQVLEDGEISEILTGMSVGARQTMVWSASGSHPRNEVRMIFLLIQCLETAMPYGGTIDVTGHKGAWQLKGTAEKFAEVNELWNIILRDEEPQNLSAAHVQFALVAMLENEMGLSVRMTQDVDNITLNVVVD
ncbi:MAG: histidine phosphotransferase family protein [Rhodobacteraceae bacterium]|nr:histidine phosphotransferase family protein [Paracoccaceae bacterium]